MATTPVLKAKNPIRKHPTPRTFHLTRIKKQVLALLAEFFCLRTNDLVGLVYHNQTEPNQASMRRTLKLLYGEGLVNRLPYVDLDTPYGNKTFAYGLTDAGIRAHLQIDGELRPKPFTEHSQRTLDHELEISFFHIALKKFVDDQAFNMNPNGTLHPLKLYWQQKDLKCTVNPDAYFAITDPTKPEGKNTFHYFLEIERAKIGAFKNGEPQIMRKLGKYYDYYNTTGCEKEWNFRTFRVIVVQRTGPKREFLLSRLAEKYRHRMFWLTTEDLYKVDIGGRIFRTPKDFTEVAYSILQ